MEINDLTLRSIVRYVFFFDLTKYTYTAKQREEIIEYVELFSHFDWSLLMIYRNTNV